MQVDLMALNIALARAEQNECVLRSVTSPSTLLKIRRGEDIRPATLGRIARTLGVDPAQLVKTEKEM